MPTTVRIPLWRRGSRPGGVGITVARRGRLDNVPRELRVDTHTCNARTRAGQVLLFLTDRVTAAQPDELRYADPSMAHPPTAQVIQHQVRHNRDVGMTVDLRGVPCSDQPTRAARMDHSGARTIKINAATLADGRMNLDSNGATCRHSPATLDWSLACPAGVYLTRGYLEPGDERDGEIHPPLQRPSHSPVGDGT